LDETGFLMTPNLTRTWAHIGETPILYHWFKHDRIALIGALVVSPSRRKINLSVRYFHRTINGLDIREYLEQLFREISGPIVLLWDRGTIHRKDVVKHWLKKHPRMITHFFPAYAPELNPAEHVWTQIDQALYNFAPATLTALSRRVHWESNRLARSQQLLWSCIYASGLPWQR
jgi:transposase